MILWYLLFIYWFRIWGIYQFAICDVHVFTYPSHRSPHPYRITQLMNAPWIGPSSPASQQCCNTEQSFLLYKRRHLISVPPLDSWLWTEQSTNEKNPAASDALSRTRRQLHHQPCRFRFMQEGGPCRGVVSCLGLGHWGLLLLDCWMVIC